MKAVITTAILLTPGVLHAQTLPGSSNLDDSKLVPSTWEVTMTFTRGDQEIVGGRTKYELARVPGGRWAYITTTTSQLGTATDTSIAAERTLEPVSHRSHAVPRMLSLDYAGATVTGTYQPTDSAGRDIQRTTEVPTFDAAMLDVVLGSLPLATGYTTRLPMYIEEQGGLVWFEVNVAGQTTVGGVQAWDVRIAVPRYKVNFMLALDDHRFLGGTVEYPNGSVIRLDRT
jgi:hypothetical protein